MILKTLAFIALLAAMAGLVWYLPFLWELSLAGVIGGVYWIFFRQSSGTSSESEVDKPVD